MEKRLSDNIKIFGFILTCFMVFYHMGTFGNVKAIGPVDAGINTLLDTVFSAMGGIIMSFFFAVTGFLLFYGLTFKNYFSKIKRRVFSLLIPYILWQCLIATMNIITGHYTFSFSDFFMKSFGFVMWPIDGAMWYVYAVFLLALCSPILLVLFKNKNVGWISVIIISLLIAAQGMITDPTLQNILNYGYIPNILFYLPAYLVGAFCGRFYDQAHPTDNLKYIMLLILIAFLTDNIFEGFFHNTAMEMLPILGLFLAPALPKLNNKKIYSLSFLMYAMHQPLISIFYGRLDRLFSDAPLPISLINITERLMLLGIDIGLAFLIWFVLKRICPKLLGVLSGGRSL